MDTTPSRKVSCFAIKSAFLSVQQQKQQQKQQQLQLQRLQKERSLPSVKNLIRLFLRIHFPKNVCNSTDPGEGNIKREAVTVSLFVLLSRAEVFNQRSIRTHNHSVHRQKNVSADPLLQKPDLQTEPKVLRLRLRCLHRM